MFPKGVVCNPCFFFIKIFIYNKIYKSILVGAWMSFTYNKGEFDRCFNWPDRPVEEFQPDRLVDPLVPVDRTDFHLCTLYLSNCIRDSFT